MVSMLLRQRCLEVSVLGNGINATASTLPGSISVRGRKTFSGELSFSGLSVTSLLNSNIGSCDSTSNSPKILLTGPSCIDGSQEFTGSLQFGNSEQSSSVTA